MVYAAHCKSLRWIAFSVRRQMPNLGRLQFFISSRNEMGASERTDATKQSSWAQPWISDTDVVRQIPCKACIGCPANRKEKWCLGSEMRLNEFPLLHFIYDLLQMVLGAPVPSRKWFLQLWWEINNLFCIKEKSSNIDYGTKNALAVAGSVAAGYMMKRIWGSVRTEMADMKEASYTCIEKDVLHIQMLANGGCVEQGIFVVFTLLENMVSIFSQFRSVGAEKIRCCLA